MYKSNIVNEYLDCLNESYIFSDKSIWINRHKFENGSKVFIIGMSGSGKSSVARILRKEYDTKFYCSFDACWEPFIKDDKPIGKKEIKEVWKCFRKITNETNCRINEGINIIDMFNEEDTKNIILNNSVIILGKSALKSSIQAAFRDSKNKKRRFFKSLIELGYFNFRYITNDINKIKKEFKTNEAVFEELKL